MADASPDAIGDGGPIDTPIAAENDDVVAAEAVQDPAAEAANSVEAEVVEAAIEEPNTDNAAEGESAESLEAAASTGTDEPNVAAEASQADVTDTTTVAEAAEGSTEAPVEAEPEENEPVEVAKDQTVPDVEAAEGDDRATVTADDSGEVEPSSAETPEDEANNQSDADGGVVDGSPDGITADTSDEPAGSDDNGNTEEQPAPDMTHENSVDAVKNLSEVSKHIRETRIRHKRQTRKTTNALDMDWSFGFNCKRSHGVHYFGDRDHEDVVFSSGHTAVVLHRVDNDQTVLQGHRGTITASCASFDRHWLVTVDSGEDCAMIVWDVRTGVPVRTYFTAEIHPGCHAVTMSNDGMYVATLSTASPQQVCIWDWTSETDEPMMQLELPATVPTMTTLSFHPENPRQLISNGKRKAIVLEWEYGGTLSFYELGFGSIDTHQFGSFVDSIFLPGTARALTVTHDGKGVVWQDSVRPNAEGKHNKTAYKLAVLLETTTIECLTCTPDGLYLVAGCGDGNLRFFDFEFRVVSWNEELGAGPITSVSFAAFDPSMNMADTFAAARTQSFNFLEGEKVKVSDYVVATSKGSVIHVSTGFENYSTVLLQAQDAAVHALCAHPKQALLAIGGYGGRLQLWNTDECTMVVSRQLPDGFMPQCMKFSPNGHMLGVGFTNGAAWLLDSLSLQEVTNNTKYRVSKGAVTHIDFSPDQLWFATADKDQCVAVFKIQPENFEDPWLYIGKNKSHYRGIVDLMFGQREDGQPRLVSLGEDRRLVEYDLEKTSFSEGVCILGEPTRVDQSAVPTCMAWHPKIGPEEFIITANSEFKFKHFNAASKVCRRTNLGPTYGNPVDKLCTIPGNPNFLVFATGCQVGLAMLPLDGNPHRAMALVAHPHDVSIMCCSHDGQHLFTSGGADGMVHMWKINSNVLAGASKLGGEDLEPFYAMVEGGKEGELFRELEDYVYFAQIQAQGLDSMEERQVSTALPLSELSNVMRAIGYFPSEEEIANMQNEIKFSKFAETGEQLDEVELPQLLKLYINHRPAFGVAPDEFDDAFQVLSKDGNLPATELYTMLKSMGEKMSVKELNRCLKILTGSTAKKLPIADMNSQVFTENILGFTEE